MFLKKIFSVLSVVLLIMLVGYLSAQEEALNGKAPSLGTSQGETQKRVEEAQEALEKAKSYFPDCPRPRECLELLEKAIELDPTLVEAYIVLGEFLYQSGNKQKASDLCKRMQEHLPNESMTYICLARFWGKGGGISTGEEASKFYRKAVELDPQNAEARRGLGRSLLRIWGEAKEVNVLIDAVHHYRKGIELDPVRAMNRKAQKDIGFAAYLVNRYDLYEESAEITELILDQVKGWRPHDMCQLVGTVDYGKKASLESLHRRILKILGRCRHTLQNEAIKHEKEGRTDDAIASFEKLKEENPYHFEVYLNLPELYLDTKQPDKAREIVADYLELDFNQADRCDLYTGLVEKGYATLAPALFATLKKECGTTPN